MTGARQRLVQQMALEYHQANDGTSEGEYGCPGVTCPGVQRLVVFLGKALAALSAGEASPQTPPLDIERLAESLIALYGAALSQSGWRVRCGEHPGERVSQQFITAIGAALSGGEALPPGDRGEIPRGAPPQRARPMQLMRDGQLVDCTLSVFTAWLREVAAQAGIRSDTDAMVIQLSSQALDEVEAQVRQLQEGIDQSTTLAGQGTVLHILMTQLADELQALLPREPAP